MPPLRSDVTRLIAAALASGLPLAHAKGFVDTIENVDGKPKRSVVWSMNGTATAHFKPEFEEERITFQEFHRRFTSREWVEANPHHPISYMYAMMVKGNYLSEFLRGQKPMALYRDGKRMAIIPHDCDPARKAEILARF